ncbi:MAG TPA: signal peptidase II [Bacillota bacterium]|nr:signal peptidase II [Candidatus Fermentithermobacillaceae bacterium]HOB29928.1 signal peptidase II [Bacillota bacterium]HOK63798.1 signal peptidase II [Bacillota bacterium]HOL11514.1 signal peptidase II [Bacillota bacterium]HOQ02571.1 signal peptidase II [Bacillota bacterium]
MAFWCSCLGILLLDQVSKWYIRSNFSVGESTSLINGWLRIEYTENAGAAFGMFQGARWIFVMISVAFIGLAIFLYPRIQGFGWPVVTALGVTMGGTMGNLVDRFIRGTVTDFICVKYFPAIFNLADTAIVVGVTVLVVVSVLHRDRVEVPVVRQQDL